MPTNLTPEQRAEISRANGAKSRGPVTEEGKESSSRNALKSVEHADRILDFVQPHYAVAANEDPASFDALLNDLVAVYQPTHAAAEAIVRDIATARWMIDRLNTYITTCWDQSIILAGRASSHLEASVRTVTELYGAGPVVTRLTREVARLQRQIAFLERQFIFVAKHFRPQPVLVAAQQANKVENEPEIVTAEADPLVIAAYREQFPGHRIVILPANQAPIDDDYDNVPPAPRRAA